MSDLFEKPHCMFSHEVAHIMLLMIHLHIKATRNNYLEVDLTAAGVVRCGCLHIIHSAVYISLSNL